MEKVDEKNEIGLDKKYDKSEVGGRVEEWEVAFNEEENGNMGSVRKYKMVLDTTRKYPYHIL